MTLILMKQTQDFQNHDERQAAILTNAVLKAASLLQVSQKDLALMLGLSESSMSRIVHHKKTLDPHSKPGELGLIFLRIFRSLDALLGGHEENSRRWFYAHNDHLNAVPSKLILTVEGLSAIARYLDALRGKI